MSFKPIQKTVGTKKLIPTIMLFFFLQNLLLEPTYLANLDRDLSFIDDADPNILIRQTLISSDTADAREIKGEQTQDERTFTKLPTAVDEKTPVEAVDTAQRLHYFDVHEFFRRRSLSPIRRAIEKNDVDTKSLTTSPYTTLKETRFPTVTRNFTYSLPPDMQMVTQVRTSTLTII